MNPPCVTCTDLHTPCPCPKYQEWLVAEYGSEEAPRGEQCATCADAEWLLSCGETLDTTAARVGLGSGGALDRHLRRHDRADLLHTAGRWAS